MVEQVLCPIPLKGTKEIMIVKVEAPKGLSKMLLLSVLPTAGLLCLCQINL